ncbi:ATP synthase F1 subunit delta [Thermanaeromonas sp. C210]|uniref:ATP synthase F1 subunit delta n=1 Tax=Thermanaeromonas sp. C210 TaxID=2731925 RepID=UPI00155C7301|nr:ATP synthase F1 subunit delta [Thermanaeromonas sp. C210]GFN22971.1 ATP synthase subunit delta [Thermanaeromonas sp. C210]
MSWKVARRYAQALFTLARERGVLAEVREELERVVSTVESEPQVGRILYHQLIPAREKKKLLAALFPDLREETRNFLYTVLDKRRERLLPQMVRQLQQLVDLAEGILEAEVITRVPVPDDVFSRLEERLGRLTGRRVRLRNRLSEEVMGGMVLKVGDRVLDASVKKRLELLKDRLQRLEVQ